MLTLVQTVRADLIASIDEVKILFYDVRRDRKECRTAQDASLDVERKRVDTLEHWKIKTVALVTIVSLAVSAGFAAIVAPLIVEKVKTSISTKGVP